MEPVFIPIKTRLTLHNVFDLIDTLSDNTSVDKKSPESGLFMRQSSRI